MFLTQSSIAAHPRLMGHYEELQANRNIFTHATESMIQSQRANMTGSMLDVNAVMMPTQQFWVEIDRQTIQMRDRETGMEIVNDLLGVQTVLPIGKTVKMYSVVGDIADDVQISMDGHPPYSFDHTEYDADGDPIPVFTAGYGANWRHAEGMRSAGFDLIIDSRAAKLRPYFRKIVDYVLNGSDRINVDGKQGQGIKNHRNTIKLNLGSGAGGANINLATATQEEIADFATSGAFGQIARANFVEAYDVMWVSPQIWSNLMRPAKVVIGGGNVLTGGTVLSVVQGFLPARSIRQSFALNGNEFIAYQRSQDVITPLVGMALGDVPLPRPLPQSNFDYQLMSAMGLQIKRDYQGKSGVVYAANLA